ncbi:MAG: sugar ABC transporter permease [Treponema sp.]|jgi:multiple sugar transport system permease protein|nr:sugar ABC transporter permease [Treponema sp.]
MNKRKAVDSQALLAAAFVMPALIYMMVFIGYPIIQNILLSLKNVDVFNFIRPEAQEFIGLENYRDLLTGTESILPKALANTLVFTVGSIFFQFIIGFALALLFNRRFPGCSFFRGVSMISWLLPVTAVGLLFKFMFATAGGIVNQFLMGLHIVRQPVEWLLSGNTAMSAIIIANIWIGIPFNMMLILAGLTTIPGEVYESAGMDGAGAFRRLFFITVPMIKPAIMSVLTLGFVYTFKVFDLAWVMTKGGPVNATQLVSTYAYRLSFEELLFSRGAASANVLFVILLLVGIFYIRTIDDNEVR